MGIMRFMQRGSEDYREYKKAIKKAKEAIETICELTEDMEDEYGYSERMSSRSHYRDGEYEERRR